MTRRGVAGLVLAAVWIVTTGPAAAQSRCTAAKYQAMGKKYLSKTKCYARAVQNNAPVDPVCLVRAETRFAQKWVRAEQRGDCFTTNDEDANEALVDSCIDLTVQSLKTEASTSTTTSAPTTTTLCTPTCAGKECGDDGCGGSCGTCAAPETCGGGGTPNVCGCTPINCAIACKNCGTIGDGCGGTLDCGVCTGSNTCGGSGIPNVCGSGTATTSTSTTSSTVTTGTLCSSFCGSCPAPFVCVGSGSPCHGVCQVPPEACTSAAAPQCGGSCAPPLFCRDVGGSCACMPNKCPF